MNSETMGYDLIALGTSAGGFDAVCHMIRQFPEDFTVPLAIVQHRARESELLAPLLQGCTHLRVTEVEDKQPVEPGHVFIAPPDYHLLIEDGAFSLSTEGPVGYSRPSIDVFFDSAADAYGPRLIGIVLTGANTDGAKGLQKIVMRGGQALVQDPDTAEVKVMPEGARALVSRARVLTLDEMVQHLIKLVRITPSESAKRANG